MPLEFLSFYGTINPVFLFKLTVPLIPSAFYYILLYTMRAGSFAVTFGLAGCVSSMTPPGLIPSNAENMTAFFDTTKLATNGAAITQAGNNPPPPLHTSLLAHNNPRTESINPPTLALDKNLAGVTFTVVMIDPDAPPLGLGGNGSQAFLHWMQDGLTSAPNSVTVQGKTVFPLENAGGIAPIQAYLYISPLRYHSERKRLTKEQIKTPHATSRSNPPLHAILARHDQRNRLYNQCSSWPRSCYPNSFLHAGFCVADECHDCECEFYEYYGHRDEWNRGEHNGESEDD